MFVDDMDSGVTSRFLVHPQEIFGQVPAVGFECVSRKPSFHAEVVEVGVQELVDPLFILGQGASSLLAEPFLKLLQLVQRL